MCRCAKYNICIYLIKNYYAKRNKCDKLLNVIMQFVKYYYFTLMYSKRGVYD